MQRRDVISTLEDELKNGDDVYFPYQLTIYLTFT